MAIQFQNRPRPRPILPKVYRFLDHPWHRFPEAQDPWC
ncbi:hypothetical protein LINGRAHAP2_LOCUS10402 [Linum grandiflorum]